MENERNIYFSAKTNIDWDTYKEMNYIKYKRMNILYLCFLPILCFLAGVLFLSKTINLTSCLLYFSLAFFMMLFGFIVKKQSLLMHGQQKVKYGKDVIKQEIEFSDRIFIKSSCDLDRVYEYSLIEMVYEAPNNYLLVMPYGVTIAVDKSSLRGSDGADFCSFIFDKCYSIKKPKFKRLKNGEKTWKRLTVVAFLIAIVVLMLYFFRITPENWRELGRNPRYSSSFQSTSGNSSNTSEITSDYSK